MAQKVVSFFKSMLKSIFFDDQRKYFSRTALMNFVFFFLAVTTWVVMIIILVYSFIREGKIDSTFAGIISGFATAITGGGFLQYSYGKVIRNNTSNGSISETPPEVSR
jgi:hypothetical protein